MIPTIQLVKPLDRPATIVTGSPAAAAHLVSIGWALQSLHIDRNQRVVFRFDAQAARALEAYRKTFDEMHARKERTQRDHQRTHHASSVQQ